MIKGLIEKENITIKNLINPVFMFKLLYKYKYIQFFITGVSGVFINLLFAYLTVNFIFPENMYRIFDLFNMLGTTIGVIVGTSVNLIYNFILHTNVTFNTKKNHKKRFLFFVLYSIFMSYAVILPITLFVRDILEVILAEISELLAKNSYLLASMITILIFSVITFLFFRLWLFKEDEKEPKE